MSDRKRIVLATIGTLGDLHPYVALARGLRDRGHDAVVAAQESYRRRVEAAGVGFHAVRPDIADLGDESAVMARVMDARRGPAYVVRDGIMHYLRQTYDDLTAAVEGADLLVTHPLTYAAQLVAEVRRGRLAWASVALAPSNFLSAHDPPVIGPVAWLRYLRPLSPAAFRPLFWLAKRGVSSWARPWHRFRLELGLPPTRLSPLFEGQFSPGLTLALFSPLLGTAQPDWPANAHVTGFPFYDGRDPGGALDVELAAFLEDGTPPIVFTLGSSAVMAAGGFYVESARAAHLLGRRAVLLVGRDPRNRPPGPLPPGVVACEYAPFSLLLPRAAAVVHQGGVGTTGQAMRAGRPMLVVPFGFDQPDNADRVVRLGVARSLARTSYRADRVARELTALLDGETYKAHAVKVSAIVQKEDGVSGACDLIEKQLAVSGK